MELKRGGKELQKQFVLKSQLGNPIPRVVNGYKKLDIRKLNRKEYKELPSYVFWEIKTGMDILYPDILMEPALLVSREVMELLVHYDETIPFLFAAMFDEEKGESASYFCPILEEEEKVEDKPLYWLFKEQGKREIRIRLDLAESLLAREAIGIAFQEL